mgnify:CR=1 FL=1
MQTILVCDDDKEIVDAIDIYLTGEGFHILKAYDGYDALKILETEHADLMIIDVMMPGLDGIRTTLKVRETSSIPIIILSAKSEDSDKILGLNIGADDYLSKPFNPLELVARVKAQLRRCTQYNEGTKEEGDILDFGGLLLNRTSHECVYNEVPLTLTPIEFDILWLLCENRGKVISSEELFEKVWHEKYYKNSNNTVMVHIRHLREKMSAPTGKSDFIKTVWGVGYKVEE